MGQGAQLVCVQRLGKQRNPRNHCLRIDSIHRRPALMTRPQFPLHWAVSSTATAKKPSPASFRRPHAFGREKRTMVYAKPAPKAGGHRQPIVTPWRLDRRDALLGANRVNFDRVAWAHRSRDVEKHPPLEEGRTKEGVALLDAIPARQIVER